MNINIGLNTSLYHDAQHFVFNINTPLARYKYLGLKLSNLLEDVIEEFGLQDKATSDGYVYVEIRKVVYGLPQAVLLAQELLEQRLPKI